MKQNLLAFLASLVMVLCSVSASAYDFMVDSIAYNIVNESEVAVTSENSASPSYSQLNAAVIPGTVTHQGITYTVTSIGKNAFREAAALKSITIPPTITTVGDSAFYLCNTLSEVHISSLESWCNMNFSRFIDNPIYYARHLFMNDQEITELVIPEGVTEIKDYVFACCRFFTSVTMPHSVISIGKSAFSYCTALTSVTIGESVKSIGNGAFQDCWKLLTAKVPDSVETLGASAFSNCNALTSVIIGNSVKRFESLLFYSCDNLKTVTMGNSLTFISNSAFSYCRRLSTVSIPKSVSKIEERSFEYCHNLISIEVDPENPYYDSRNNCNAIIHTSTNTLLAGCMNTVIPNTVEVIGSAAFMECPMEEMPIPNSVKRIEWIAFWLCRNLKTIHIPSSVTLIEHSAFNECSGALSISVDSDNPVYDSRDSCNAIIETATDKLLLGCQNTVIPNSIKIIGDGSFEECYGLETVQFGDSVISTELNSFYGCRNLTKVTLGKSLQTIGRFTFYYCDKIESITLPATVTSIGENAFHYCKALKSVISYAVTPPAMPSADTFSDYNTPVLYVPEESLEAYRTTDCWSRFATILPIKKGDANGDSQLDINDLTELIDMLLSNDTSAINVVNADVDGDGTINIADLTELIDMLLHETD